MDEEKKFWVALSTHQKIGARTFAKLYKRFKKMANVWRSSSEELARAGLDLGQIEAVKVVIANKDPEKEWQKLAKYHLEVLIYPEKVYPKILKEIADPPGILYVRGKILPQDELALAVVGSRRYTTYGREAVERLVWPLVQKKITIVSGLALGIDSLAHLAALAAGGRTIAVLACGLDQIYPACNVRLADKILAGRGAIISEYPLGMPTFRYNFPVRNRIIAGLSLGTLVVEAGLDSGSLLTASAAIDYNREVFAVPGSIFSETSQGTNKLLKMGGKVVTSYEDILEELHIEEKKEHIKAQEIIADSREEEILLKLLKSPQAVDKLVEKSGYPTSIVNVTIIEMEMKGKIRNLGGTRYEIKGELKEK